MGQINLRLISRFSRASISVMAALFAVLILMSCVQTQKRPDTPQPSPQLTTPATLFLDVQGPIDGVTVEGDAVVVHGATSPGATLSINGAVVSVGSDGSFKVEVPLLAGPNIIELVATRSDGKQERRVLELISASPTSSPFLLVITEPQDQSILHARVIPLSGRTGPQGIVSVNGVGVSVDRQGAFSTSIILEEGPNIIEVVASNIDGRVLSAIIAVIFRP